MRQGLNAFCVMKDTESSKTESVGDLCTPGLRQGLNAFFIAELLVKLAGGWRTVLGSPFTDRSPAPPGAVDALPCASRLARHGVWVAAGASRRCCVTCIPRGVVCPHGVLLELPLLRRLLTGLRHIGLDRSPL